MAGRNDQFAQVDLSRGNPINYVPARDGSGRIWALPPYVDDAALTHAEVHAAIAGEAQQPGHPRYYELLDELRQLHHDKNRAYGSAADPFKNFTNGEDYGISKVKMIVGRLADKISRFQNDAKRDFALIPGMGQDSETPEQTYRDLASLFLILIVTLEERRAAEKESNQ